VRKEGKLAAKGSDLSAGLPVQITGYVKEEKGKRRPAGKGKNVLFEKAKLIACPGGEADNPVLQGQKSAVRGERRRCLKTHIQVNGKGCHENAWLLGLVHHQKPLPVRRRRFVVRGDKGQP